MYLALTLWKLCLAVDEAPDDKVLVERFTAAVYALERHEVGPFMMAKELLYGRRIGIVTDNPESVRLIRSMVADLGATVQEFEQDDGKTKMLFAPAVKS
jgi:hypothetical protein